MALVFKRRSRAEAPPAPSTEERLIGALSDATAILERLTAPGESRSAVWALAEPHHYKSTAAATRGFRALLTELEPEEAA